MSSPVFVRDAQGTPLMPTSAAYARRLLRSGKAHWAPHHAFPVIQLTQVVLSPALQPVVVGVIMHLHTAELLVVAGGEPQAFPLLHVVVDLRTDMPVRLRRRAGHRRRRRARGRYRPIRRYGRPYKLRRPSLARSTWGRALRPRRRRRRGPNPSPFSPTMRWRGQAIARVIGALRSLVPVSHVLILSPAKTAEPGPSGCDARSLRQQLIDTYGAVTNNGARVAMCAYCGSTAGRIEAEHVWPMSRGGTDRWSNRVLACAACNARKGDRTPEEAGMSLRVPPLPTPASPNRAGVYARWTARALAAQVSAEDLRILWLPADRARPAEIPPALYTALRTLADTPDLLPVTIAKPVPRPVKQVFSARTYPGSTPLRPGFSRVRYAIKRRVRVNQALMIFDQDGRRRVRVVPAETAVPQGAVTVIRQGMLCEGQRATQKVVGVVAAIHSTGRLTLLAPDTVRVDSITWRRVVISTRQHLRVLSTDRVLFVRAGAATSDTDTTGATSSPEG